MAIGASAGALAALRTFFANVPRDSGLAFVVVVHLSPDHPSYLPDLLQPYASIPVQSVTSTEEIQTDRVYIIPPGSYLTAVDTHLRLSEPEGKRYERGPIDHFFRTLAATHDGHCVAVVLTGTGSDGTLGGKAIKEKGGFLVVQDPEDAEFDGMPQSAIATGLVDLVLPVAEMPSQISRITSIQPMLAVMDDEQADSKPVRTIDERELLQMFALVRARTRRDFSHHKRSTILRRTQRRMQLRQVETLGAYLQLLRAQPEEVFALADEFLITVTTFFRDPEVYDALERSYIPRLFDAKAAGDHIRAWSVGCATGEEAYSLAILFLEEASRREIAPHVEIFASDLHDGALKVAREGLYTGQIEADISPDRLRRFFMKENGGYRVRNEVREHIVFAQHNLLADPPFSKLDLIACRNLLIYLERGVQREVFGLFHYSLNPDGVLVLGRSETIDAPALFVAEDKSHGLHRKRNTPSPESRLPVFLLAAQKNSSGVAWPAGRQAGSYGSLHQRMVEQYAPPSMLVGPDRKVMHLSEHAGRYLRVPGGEPTTSVFNLVRDELRTELFAALREAEQKRAAVQSRPVRMHVDGSAVEVVIHVRPANGGDEQGFSLVIFDDRPVSAASETSQEVASPGTDSPLAAREVEAELEGTRHRLQSVIEEYETSQEEMKTSNEELQSVNEELRSTMEELETSREELQSINEELITLNQENRHKVDELSQLTSDLQNLMVATDIATLFIDRDLRILRFTPRLGDLFNVRETDRGRPASDLTHRLDYGTLVADARQVLEKLTPVEREVRDNASRWYLARLLPYRSSDDRIGGVVITFIDITAQKRAAQEVAAAKEYAEDIVQTIDEPLMTLTPDLRVKSANSAFYAHFQTRPEETEGLLVYSVGNGQWDIPQLRTLLEDILPGNTIFNDYEVAHNFDRLGERVILVNARPLGHTELILLGFRDVTELKRVERALREADRRKDEFMATLAHELRNPLAAINNALQIQRLSGNVAEDPRPVDEVVGRQVKHLLRLVDDLLDVSRITRGKVELRMERVDLRSVVRSAIETIKPLIEASDSRVSVHLPSEAVMADIDPVRIAQVVSNLLTNAAKFSPHGHIWVAVTRTTVGDAISVRDDGVGIPAAMLSSVFDAFVQADSTTARTQTGLGLGLTLVRNLVDLHGGRVEARSAGLGHGSEFIVHLPSRRTGSSAGQPEAQPVPADASESGVARCPVTRVLIVDDNHDGADTLAMMLQCEGHDVQVAYDGPSALEALATYRPAFLLVDIGMPGMDGYEVARRVRALREFDDLTLVALTGWGHDEARRRSADAGFDRHLVKPVTIELLQTVLAAGRKSVE